MNTNPLTSDLIRIDGPLYKGGSTFVFAERNGVISQWESRDQGRSWQKQRVNEKLFDVSFSGRHLTARFRNERP